jgi:hypothetical protein
MQPRPVFLDVGDLQVDRLRDPQAAGVNQPEDHLKTPLAHLGQEPRDLLAREHGGQFLGVRTAHEVEQLPVVTEEQSVIGAHRRDRAAHRRG